MLRWNGSRKTRSLAIPKAARLTKVLRYVTADTPIEFDAVTTNGQERVLVNGRRSEYYIHSAGKSNKRIFNVILDKGMK